MKPSVYLAGPITGLAYRECTDWREGAKEHLAKFGIDAFSPMRKKDFLARYKKLSPHGYDKHPLSTAHGITTRDRMDCTTRNLVIANFLGAKQISAGTCIEFGWADGARVPVIAVMEEKGNPHDHGMINEIAGYRVESLEEALDLAVAILQP
jgi:nucleoside 2-deoxyribosyltransferase